MTDDRIMHLEALLAPQDDALRQLSDALYGQQRQIQALERELERLTQRLEAAEHPAGDQPGHEIPPHY